MNPLALGKTLLGLWYNKKMARKPPKTGKQNEDKMVKVLDQLDLFERLKKEIMPCIIKDLAKGFTAEELRNKYLAKIQAAQLTQALTDPKAAAERKDVLDRSEGKATEKREITHRLKDLPEEELDALLLSEVGDMNDD